MAASQSSLLPRLTLSRDSSPLLPFYNRSPSRSLRSKPSEYDLSDLSPRSDKAQTPSQEAYRDDDTYSAPSTAQGRADTTGSNTLSSPKGKSRVMFAGPPPPIARSTVIYRDAEEADSSSASSPGRQHGHFSASTALSSVLFSRVAATLPGDRGGAQTHVEPDSTWQSLQRRENALQEEIQRLLDIQSTGLSAGLGRPVSATPSPAPSPAAGDTLESNMSGTSASRRSSGSLHPSRSRVSLDQPARATSMGEVIPVRQPQKRPMGLRAARAGLGRTMALLADLKAEEEAALIAALSARKSALARMRRMSARRDGLAEELRALESDDEEPLARQLRELGEEHHDICDHISELEGRLTALRNRKRRIEGDMEILNNRREAGLSGYRGALREVEAQIAATLRRPLVKPLDVAAFIKSRSQSDDGRNEGDSFASEPPQSPGGLEFLRLRPERRTASMAKDWWENEVEILERRKSEVDKNRAALDEGGGVWKAAVTLVSEFEADLRDQMKTGGEGSAGGTPSETSLLQSPSQSPLRTHEDTLRTQLAKMRTVSTGLEELVHTAEHHGWNLLICAIGAELEAFKEAEMMLREAMRGSGVDPDDEDTPRLARSTTETKSQKKEHSESGDALVDFPSDKSLESDNEVPADLLVSRQDEDESEEPSTPPGRGRHRDKETDTILERDDSENEIPPEFLREHHSIDGGE